MLVVESVGASVKSRGGPWLSVHARSRRSALAAMAVAWLGAERGEESLRRLARA